MKHRGFIFGALFSVFLLMVSTQFISCEKHILEEDGIPILPLKPDIINPPDSFKVIFPLSNAGFIGTIISFDTTAFWRISRQNAFSARFQVSGVNDSLPAKFIEIDTTMLFNKNIEYEFLARNTYPSYRSLIVIFRILNEPDTAFMQ